MSDGPYLYDEDPAPLHTGSPRSRQAWIVGGIAFIVLFSVAMVAGLYLLKGSPAEQSTRAATVFLASLSDGDTDTAVQMLCEDERERLEPGEIADAYLGAGPGEIGELHDDDVEGAAVQLVPVRWADGSTTEWRVLNEDGPRVCGVATTD